MEGWNEPPMQTRMPDAKLTIEIYHADFHTDASTVPFQISLPPLVTGEEARDAPIEKGVGNSATSYPLNVALSTSVDSSADGWLHPGGTHLPIAASLIIAVVSPPKGHPPS